MAERRPVPGAGVDDAERLRRVVMILRQAAYFIGDELGKEYGLSRPCKVCDAARRAEPRAKPERVA